MQNHCVTGNETGAYTRNFLFYFRTECLHCLARVSGMLKLRPFKAGVGVSSGLVEEKGCRSCLIWNHPSLLGTCNALTPILLFSMRGLV